MMKGCLNMSEVKKASELTGAEEKLFKVSSHCHESEYEEDQARLEAELKEEFNELMEYDGNRLVVDSSLSVYREHLLKLRKKSSKICDFDTTAHCKDNVRMLNELIHALDVSYSDKAEMWEKVYFFDHLDIYDYRELVLFSFSFYSNKLIKLRNKSSKIFDECTLKHCLCSINCINSLRNALINKYIDSNDELPF